MMAGGTTSGTTTAAAAGFSSSSYQRLAGGPASQNFRNTYLNTSSSTSSASSNGRKDTLEGGSNSRLQPSRPKAAGVIARSSSRNRQETSENVLLNGSGGSNRATDHLDSKMSTMQLAEEVRPAKPTTTGTGSRSYKGSCSGNGCTASTTTRSVKSHDFIQCSTTTAATANLGVLSSSIRFQPSRSSNSNGSTTAPFCGIGPAEFTSSLAAASHRLPAGSNSNGATAAASGSATILSYADEAPYNQIKQASLGGGSITTSTSSGRRQLTVPKSPHFSIMSWQRKPGGSYSRRSSNPQPKAWK